MKTSSNNPPSNQLRAGVDEQQITDAVRKSGYPLQSFVAATLRNSFGLKEEWSYIDGDHKGIRTLDILAERRLYLLRNENQPRIRPTLDLLIECKQSDLPYIFFLSEDRPWITEFPVLAGLFKNSITVTTDDDRSTYTTSIIASLDLHTAPFLRDDVECCATFSKCVRKGKELELSGTEAYQNIVLPIVKALRYFQIQEAPPNTAYYHDCHLALAIAVLDAPMIGARLENDIQVLGFLPWVRVVRHEAADSEDFTERSPSYAVDFVHKDFFKIYIEKNVLPFAEKFAELALKHHTEIATGKGFAKGMGRQSFLLMEPRLKPSKRSRG
jgi:hypothetical protein